MQESDIKQGDIIIYRINTKLHVYLIIDACLPCMHEVNSKVLLPTAGRTQYYVINTAGNHRVVLVTFQTFEFIRDMIACEFVHVSVSDSEFAT